MGRTTALMCPHCGEPMVALELEGVEIDCCLQCGGTWLDYGELAQIAERAGAASGGVTEALYSAAAGEASRRRCPRCGKKLRKVAIAAAEAGPAGEPIEVDRCPREDGIWFDKGEMKAVVERLATGSDAEAEAVARFFADMFRHEIESENTDPEGE